MLSRRYPILGPLHTHTVWAGLSVAGLSGRSGRGCCLVGREERKGHGKLFLLLPCDCRRGRRMGRRAGRGSGGGWAAAWGCEGKIQEQSTRGKSRGKEASVLGTEAGTGTVARKVREDAIRVPHEPTVSGQKRRREEKVRPSKHPKEKLAQLLITRWASSFPKEAARAG